MVGLLAGAASAQSMDSAQFMDYVTLQDTDVYMFHPRPDSLRSLDGYHQAGATLGLFVQQYVPQDTVTVYGVALTINSWGGTDLVYQNPNYTAVMMQRPQGVPDSVLYAGSSILTYRTLRYLDSVQLDTSLHTIHFTKFRYEYDLPKPSYETVPCYEFYFDTPQVMTDTFYVGKKYLEDGFPPSEYMGWCTAPLPYSTFWYIGSYWGDLDTTMIRNVTPGRLWGFSFPIIGFHCKPVDSLQLTGVYYSGATVQWRSVEEGATYNVRLTSSDGSIDSTVVTTDTSCTFYQLPQYKRYNIQVRKQCHYATVSYDTMVYSPAANSGFVLGDACPSVQNMQVEQLGDTVTVTWDDFTAYSRVSLRYGTANQPQSQWQEVDVTGDTSYTLTGLLPGARYGVTMQAYCEYNGAESPWGEAEYFYTADTTAGGGTEGIVTADGVDFSVSPNPVHGVVEVTLPEPMEADGMLSLYDLGGREVRQTAVPAGSNRVTLDTEGCPAGAYLLKLISPQGVATRRLLVK